MYLLFSINIKLNLLTPLLCCTHLWINLILLINYFTFGRCKFQHTILDEFKREKLSVKVIKREIYVSNLLHYESNN